jgi:hypothetical protein
MEIKEPDVNFGRFNLDFGKGFYVTTMQEQAEKWAPRRSVMAKKHEAIINIYEFETTGLNIHSFNGYSEEWLDFVLLNRVGNAPLHEYDAIFGNMADDDVAATVNYYISLLEKGRVEAEDKMFFLRQLRFSKPNNQYCIATQKGINALKFSECYRMEV